MPPRRTNVQSGVKPPRKKKTPIPTVLKDNVWNQYIGPSKGNGKCKCCQQNEIFKNSFHCGHIVAESKGGATTIGNLRPVCGRCNQSMGTKNMIDFMIENGLSCDYLHQQDEMIENIHKVVKESDYLEKIKNLEMKVEKLEIELSMYREWKDIIMKSVPEDSRDF